MTATHPILTSEQIEEVLYCCSDHRHLCSKHLKIYDMGGICIPFKWNFGQEWYWENGGFEDPNAIIRHIVLKYRQELGFSTKICSIGFRKVYFQKGFEGKHITQGMKYSRGFARKYKVFHENLPDYMKIPGVKANTLDFSIPHRDSYMFFESGEADAPIRSGTYQFMNLTEYPFYNDPDYVYNACNAAVHKLPGTVFIIDSTPNMLGDAFHTKYFDAKAGKNQFTAFFFPWWSDPTLVEYSDQPLELSDKELGVQKAFQLAPEQMRWRQNKIKEYAKSTDPDYGERIFRREFPEDEITCFESSVYGYFSGEIIRRELLRIDAEGIKTQEVPNLDPRFKIFEKPLSRHRYAISADVAEGGDDADFDSCHIIDIDTLRNVAICHGRFGETFWAELLNDLGRYYNTATIAVERNGPGLSVLALLNSDLYNYPELYREYDLVEDRGVLKKVESLGFRTTGGKLGKSFLLNQLRNGIYRGEYIILDKDTFFEMQFFQKKGGKLEAVAGQNDDRVMSVAIGYYVAIDIRDQGITIY